MSKWRKALKNKRRFDARYFLSEKVEGQEVIENSVQQEKLKKDFRDFSFDSWLTEAEEAIDEAHCGSHKRDDEELEEAKGNYDNNNGKDEKCDHVDCEGVEEGLEELHVHHHTAKDFSGATVPITDEEPPVKKKEDPEKDPEIMRRSRVKQMRANAEARRNKSNSVKSEN